MSLLRSARFPAIVLLVAAAAGLVVANSPLGGAVEAALHVRLGIPGVFELSIEHWITDGLLALFFFVVAVELLHELTAGELDTPRKAVLPALAAAGGVLVPIGLFLIVAGSSEGASGWPIPTATDIAFALGVLAIFGRGLPTEVRAFLLALAILDDIVGIVFIAVLYTADLDVLLVVAAVLSVLAFGWLSRRLGRGRDVPLAVGLGAIGVVTWILVSLSGVHATIAGVALGLAMAPRPAMRVRRVLEPWVNALVLPLFAFAAALVVIPAVSPAQLSPVFWGIVLALPLGKLGGITLFAAVSQRLLRSRTRLPLPDLMVVGALGGIGFTVSLLLCELAFRDAPLLRDEATLGVLAGSAISIVVAAALVSWRAWHHRTTPAT